MTHSSLVKMAAIHKQDEHTEKEMATMFLVIGGGIAGVSCAEMLPFHCPGERVTLITASPLIKTVTNVVPCTKTLFQFDVEERPAETLSEEHADMTVLHDTVVSLDTANHRVFTQLGRSISYQKLCICSGGQPKLISEDNPHVIGIRDLDSVKMFQERVSQSRRLVVVGNGGIASEVVYEVEGVEMVWVVKDNHISATFVDPGAAQFFQSSLAKGKVEKEQVSKRMKYTVSSEGPHKGGAALGPDWHGSLHIRGSHIDKRNVTVEYNSEVKCLREGDETWPVYVELTNGKTYGCDLVVSATGVTPNVSVFTVGNPDLEIAPDGGLKVDAMMQTTSQDVLAAGDACTASWDPAPHWFQMRLWRQAWQMGGFAARCMSAKEDVLQDFCFELFSHVTQFYGYKVVLLGLYNGQTLKGEYEILVRVTPGVEYVKLVMKDGRMQGAVLIGETDLEEMCENLILDQLDLTDLQEHILDPDIDIDDYFD
uniref:Pyridine nucleotide-disulfide oxidoreductase domain-containing protein 1 n=1 Tax=Timema monikensis TaxID=170555 RepID=A0A7R9E4I4_9NEOP|nr:unnamed protein product [Timema monikensis]